MNKSRFFWVGLALWLVGPGPLAASELIVSPTGRDDNPGTLERPLASVERACAILRESRQPGSARTENTVIRLRGGIYPIDHGLVLSAQDSVGPKALLCIEPYSGERVVFDGGDRFAAGELKPVSDPNILRRIPEEARTRVRQLDLRARGITNYGVLRQHGFGSPVAPAPMELFIDGQPQHLARYPNVGILKIGRVIDKGSTPRTGDRSGRGATFKFLDARPEKWQDATDIWLHGRFSFGYSPDNLRVEQIDLKAGTFHLAQPHLYGVMSSDFSSDPSWSRNGQTLRGYYAYNLLEELDAPGEYYLDRHSGILYTYIPEREQPKILELSRLEDPFITLSGASYVTISGITFRCGRGMAILQEGTHHISIRGCTFANLGTVGVSMGERLQPLEKKTYADGSPLLEYFSSDAFHDNEVSDCRFFNNGAGGVIVAGGNRKDLTGGRNLVADCEFFGNSRINEAYSPGVRLFGVGHVVRNCYFHDQIGQSLSFQGNDFVIEHNVFERACENTDDMGPIYTGRDPSARGTHIRENFFTENLAPDAETRTCGIYLDDGTGGIVIERNIFCRTGTPGKDANFAAVFMHGGYGNAVVSNWFIDCAAAVGHARWDAERWRQFLESPLMTQRLRKDVDLESAAYLTHYPELKGYFAKVTDRLNSVRNNRMDHAVVALNGDLSLSGNRSVEDGLPMKPSEWTLAEVIERFGSDPSLAAIVSKPIGLIPSEFRRWHPESADQEISAGIYR